MNFRKWIVLLLVFVMGCGPLAPSATPTITPSPSPAPTPTLQSPEVQVVRPPDPVPVVEAFFEAWKRDDWAAMYAHLAAGSQQAISAEDFAQQYYATMVEAAVGPGDLGIDILSSEFLSPERALVAYELTLASAVIGDIVREHQMYLTLADGEWRIGWDVTHILPDLAGGNVLRMINIVPPRGLLYAREGEPLVDYIDAYAVGVVPWEIDPEVEKGLLSTMGRATGIPWENILGLYLDTPDYEFYVPVTSVAADVFNPYYNAVLSYSGAYAYMFNGRYYLNAGAAPHAVGYVQALQPEEVDEYRRLGYQWTERVPRQGLEFVYDEYLSGARGGTLYLDDANGNVVTPLGEGRAQPASTITTTLNLDLQLRAQQALTGFRGAVVVMERDTGRVLALASSPGFDPNLFEPDNYNSVFDSPLLHPNQPLFNRAIQGLYPLGSVFKIITLAAALESGFYTAESTYDCQYEFTELPSGPILYDWTYEHNQRDPEVEELPSGMLTLPEGLMRSCNPWFWHIGLDFFERGETTLIAEMARGFGLGNITGIDLPGEVTGQVPEPTERLDATNLAIGQGGLQVTPLQVAAFVAAVGNGGTLYRPQLVEKIVDAQGSVEYQFEPEPAGTLPVSPENLAIIRDAMVMVVESPRGTAYRVMGAFPRIQGVVIAGKTGSVEVGGGLDSHAWYVVFSDANLEDKPDIAIAVLVENEGEGADFAAPIALRMLEVYFVGRPITKFPWELRIGVREDIFPEEEEDEDEDSGSSDD